MSVVLNGTNQYLALAEALATEAPITIVAFFKAADITTFRNLVSICKSTSDVDYFALEQRGTSVGDPIFAMARSSSTNAYAATSSGFSADTWHHAAARFELYYKRYANLDGGSEGENSVSVTPGLCNRTGVGVLYRLNPAFFMAGKIAEVAVWDKYLTDEELELLAGGEYPSNIQAGNLLAYWPLFDNANDESGNAKHLTPVNSPTFDTVDHPAIAITLSGSSTGQSNVPNAKLTRYDTQLAGSSTGQSGASGILAAEELIGSSAGQSNVPNAKLTMSYSLKGTSVGQSGVIGTLCKIYHLVGNSAGQSGVSGDLFIELATKTLFWRPENKIREILAWKTEILRAHKGIEQRIKLRQTPRQFFRLQLVLNTNKINSWFDSILHIWQKRAWKIPIWTEFTIHTEDINSGDATIYLDTKFADYRNNSYAIIWKSSSEYEIIFISTKTTSQLNLKFNINHSFTGIKYIAPCRIAYMVSTNTKQKYNSPASITEVLFAVYDNVSIADYTPEMIYDNLGVLISPAYMNETHQEESDGQIEINDFQTGIFRVRSNKEYNLLSQNHIVYNDTKEACWKYRQLLHWLNGRQKAVLIPTFRNDLNLIDSIAPTDTNFFIENIKLTINMGFNTLRTYVGFYFPDKTLLIRKIIAIEEIDSVKEEISINESLGRTVNPGDCKICFVDKCRLASDRVEIDWPFAHRNECRSNLIRVS